MNHLRIATWGLFVAMAIVHACWAWVLFTADMPLLGALSAVTVILALSAATILHLLFNAYEAEHLKLMTVNSGIDRLTAAVLLERRRARGSGPEEVTDL